MRRFSEVLDELALRDLPLQGGPYTWSGGLNGQSKSRLDRFLISEDWENHFSGVSQCTLPRPVSDHSLILLDGGGVRRGPIPFCFENMWLKEEGFKELLKGWWQGFNYSGSYSFVLSEKLKALKVKLKNWNKEVFAWSLIEYWREEAARLEEMFSLEEVYLALSELNEDEAPGLDGFPIAFCLVGGLYKILTKVLANRLKKVVSKVVSPTQNAFVEGRQILDAALIANEAIDSLLKGDEAGVLCKLDLEKAYDHINWDFLMSVMQKMGFGEKWVSWIRWCISTTSFSVLINSSPVGFFQSIRGLRQRDPISPYLFVLGMEALSCLINKAVREGFLFGCRLRGRSGNGIQVSHLLFADNTLVFCEDSQDQMVVLSWLLMWFEAISGLNINLNKSEILPVGRVENVEVLASALGCKVGSLPSTYLGLPLGAPHKSVVVWDGVEERMRKRLALWKRQFISKGGRITLIRSTLASMPIYLMSLMCIPRVVRLRLEKIQRDFLWGGGALEKRPHLVNWRFAAERESFWKLIISTKYGEEGGGWISREVREGYGVGLWKEIRKEGVLMFKNVFFTVGDGRRVKFWKDIWCGNIPLCEAFPSLFAFAVSQDAWVADCWDSMGDAGGWYPCFSRPFNDWELEAVASLLSFLQGKRLNVGMEDRVLWNASKNGIFSVKSLYNTLDSGGAVPFPWRIIWSPCVPTKVGFFAWEASWGKVLTQDQLKRRGWILANRCFLCCDDEETINHVLIHCPKARVLWNLVFSLFRVNWVLPLTVRDTLLGWSASFVDKKRGKTWRAAPLYVEIHPNIRTQFWNPEHWPKHVLVRYTWFVL
ncbi:putative ribonuclease H protein [Vitis vinifera]|uniref:Putative ribonuclease H protein n=1 Tax=Vitis vinifera TaxID=29760 RepID=A0A438IVG7_VITVI|nr:putative ribonuclease H protein [Vitis vinifera]